MADKVGKAVVAVSGVLIAVGVMAILRGVDPAAVGRILEQGITLVVLIGLVVGIIFAILGKSD